MFPLEGENNRLARHGLQLDQEELSLQATFYFPFLMKAYHLYLESFIFSQFRI